MNRFLAFILALLVATVTVSSACTAAQADWIRFTLEPERNGTGQIHASFTKGTSEYDRNQWSSGFPPSELIGLDTSGFRSSGTKPLRFAVVREAGRLDCAGTGGGSHAWGNCSFTPDAGFMQLLASQGIARPSREQGLGLMALNVRRELVQAIAAARYPAPTVDQLMALTAVGVNGRYITSMAQAGYRPQLIERLVEFRAIGVTPEWIGGFARIGYGGLPSNELVQLRAMNITPEFVAGFDRAGYRHLPPSTLVQLKAMDITPQFAREAAGGRSALPPVNELVEMKIFGRRR